MNANSWKINPDNPLVYRMIQKNLLAPILRNGCISCPNNHDIPEYENYPLGKPNMKEKRSSVKVDVPPGGSLHDYVAFYFAPRSPMLFSLHMKNFEGVQCEQEDIIYLVSDMDRLLSTEQKIVVTDRNAILSHAKFEHQNIKQFLKTSIDWEVMRLPYWADHDNSHYYGYGKEVRHAECLVHQSLSVNDLLGIATKNDIINSEIKIITENWGYNFKVLTKKEWYF